MRKEKRSRRKDRAEN